MPVAQRQIEAFQQSILPGAGEHCAYANSTILLASGTAYAVALDVVPWSRVITRILYRVSVAGSGSVVGEAAIGTSPNTLLADVAATINITPQNVVSLGFGGLTTIGDKNLAFTVPYTISPGVQAWIMLRTQLATTQPTISSSVVGVGGVNSARSLASTGSALTAGVAKAFTAAAATCPLIALA